MMLFGLKRRDVACHTHDMGHVTKNLWLFISLHMTCHASVSAVYLPRYDVSAVCAVYFKARFKYAADNVDT